MVFASDRIYQFDGSYKSLLSIYPVQKGIGCISKRSPVVAEGIIYWMDENGIYASPNAGYSVNLISWDIQPTFDALNKARLQYSVGVHFRYKRQIWWAVSDTTSTTHNKILVYNYGLSNPLLHPLAEGARHVWSVYDLDLMSMAEILSAGEYTVWGGDSGATGFVHQVDSGTTDNTATISWDMQTKRTLITCWSEYSVLRKVDLIHENENTKIDIDLYVDNSRTVNENQEITLAGEGAYYGSAAYGGSRYSAASNFVTPVWYNRLLMALQLKMSGADNGKQPRVFEIAMELMPKRGSR
jgi:hypothetical protein